MNTFRYAVLLTVVFTIPLQQLLYVSIAGISVKTYQLLLLLLGALSLLHVRENQSMSDWQKLGLAFFLISVCAEIAGYIELLNFGDLPELKYIGSLDTLRFTINLYLLLNMLFAWQVICFVTEVQNGLRTVLTVAALGSVFPALYALYQLFSFLFGFEIQALEFSRIIERPDAPRGIFFESGIVRFASTYFEPGPYGGYLSIILPLTMMALMQWQADKHNSTVPKWLKLILLLNVVALLLSFSTSALVGMTLFALMVPPLIYSLSRVLKTIIIALTTILLIIALTGQWEFVLNAIDTAFLQKIFAEEKAISAVSRTARLYQAEVGLRIFLDHPLIGIGPFVPYFFEIYAPSVDATPQAISIIYINVLVQTGLVGASVFFYALSKLLKALLTHTVSAPDEMRKAHGIILLGLFVVILTLFFTLGSLVAVHFWLAIGVMIGWLNLQAKVLTPPQTVKAA
ncbi:MAG: O-antigen ligase family protein [Candidatus Thermochlorobacter sp.]